MLDNSTAPWAGIGSSVNEATTVAEAMQDAGLDWSVGIEPLYRQNEDGSVGDSVSRRAVVRQDNDSVLGTVGPKWTPYQNADAFQWFQPYIDSNHATFETAGALGKGSIVWILAKLNRDNVEIAAGDEVSKYLLLSNSHNGTLAVRVGFTPIRVWCTNTLSMAHSSNASRLIRIRHSQNVTENVNAMQDIVNLADADFEATAEQYRFLASRQINTDDLEKYVLKVLGKNDALKDVPTRTKNQFEEIVGMFESGRGNANLSVAGTWWAAYNGVTEWLNYSRGRNADNRLSSLWFGVNASVNKQAFETAVAMAG